MRIKLGPHVGIRKLSMPLTERTLNAHLEDLTEWMHSVDDDNLKEEYFSRIKRIEGLWKRLQSKKESSPH